MSGCDVDEVLIIKLVELFKKVHVSCDIRGSCSLHGDSEVWRQRGLITGVVQYRHGLHFSVQPEISHAVLPELDWNLIQPNQNLISHVHVFVDISLISNSTNYVFVEHLYHHR